MCTYSLLLLCSSQQNEGEEEDESDPEKLKKKAEIWWGLSDSSTNLAKELLPSDFITLSPSQDLSFFEHEETPDTPDAGPPVPPAESEPINESGVLDTEQLITKHDSSLSLVTMVGPSPLQLPTFVLPAKHRGLHVHCTAITSFFFHLNITINQISLFHTALSCQLHAELYAIVTMHFLLSLNFCLSFFLCYFFTPFVLFSMQFHFLFTHNRTLNLHRHSHINRTFRNQKLHRHPHTLPHTSTQTYNNE